MLALVDNLSEVYWDDPSGYSDSITIKEMESILPELTDIYNQEHNTNIAVQDSIKDYSRDAYHLQILRNILGI